MYHLTAVFLGTVAGIFTLVGLAVLILRRRLVGPVFTATTRNDKAMYVVLAGTIVLGLLATARANVLGDGYDYRETVSPWFRSLFYLQPKAELMAGVPSTSRCTSCGLRALRVLALHPARARVQRAGRLPHPPVRGLPEPGHPARPACHRPGWDGPTPPPHPEDNDEAAPHPPSTRGAALNLAIATSDS
jgi:nitrate reductase gamma subunit